MFRPVIKVTSIIQCNNSSFAGQFFPCKSSKFPANRENRENNPALLRKKPVIVDLDFVNNRVQNWLTFKKETFIANFHKLERLFHGGGGD